MKLEMERVDEDGPERVIINFDWNEVFAWASWKKGNYGAEK